ncbi:MAG: cupin domain-containing protein [Spartobacteria bacterium]
MKTLRHGLLVIAVIAVASVVIGAQKKEMAANASDHKIFDTANMEWGDVPPEFPAGAKLAVLAGNPGEKGVFTVRLKTPAGYKIMPHTHPTAENITVISGAFHIGMGEKFDESAGHAMAQGAFTSMPTGMQHFGWSTEETIIQVHGEGPFQIDYVNPADDPRNAKK